jgi:hypothetical protein
VSRRKMSPAGDSARALPSSAKTRRRAVGRGPAMKTDRCRREEV